MVRARPRDERLHERRVGDPEHHCGDDEREDPGPAARERNVRSAFAMRAGCNVDGKRVVIVDDVITTGATVEECARVLKGAGAASIGILVLARALRIGR